MKSLKLSLLACVVTTGIALLSCKSDPCEKTVCLNSGVKTALSDGKSCACNCPAGFMGDSCQVAIAAVAAGNYSAVETGSKSGSSAFIVGITKVNDTTMSVSNVWNNFKNKVNIVLGTGSKFTIAEQQPDSDKFYVSGSGTFTKSSSGKFTFSVTYKVDDRTTSTAATDNLSATWTQQ